jgi:hypothetical protein
MLIFKDRAFSPPGRHQTIKSCLCLDGLYRISFAFIKEKENGNILVCGIIKTAELEQRCVHALLGGAARGFAVLHVSQN